MRELRDILRRYQEIAARGSLAALATVVGVRGSAYRRPGARMLVAAGGDAVGAISGGCLDRDVLERARRVIESGEPELVTYDTTADEDLVWGMGLGCNGVVDVLLERVPAAGPCDVMEVLAHALRGREPVALATVVRAAEGADVRLGDRLAVPAGGDATGRISGPATTAAVVEAATAALGARSGGTRAVCTDRGAFDLFVEVVEPPVPLVVFGAGNDAVPVARFARELGWHVTVVDARAAYATIERFPDADEIVVARPEATGRRLRVDHRTAALVMTHNFPHDVEIVRALLASPARYVGLLGPRPRAARLLDALRAEGVEIASGDLARLYAPVGVDIGAESPEAIALSIVAEVQAVLAGRGGGHLRDRAGGIHESKDRRVSSPEPAPPIRAACRTRPSAA